jgi:hypothetical protein
MHGSYRIVCAFADRQVRAELGEDVLHVSEGSDDWFIAHFVDLKVGGTCVSLFLDDVDSVLEVLTKAQERAQERLEKFYTEPEVSSLSTTIR